MQIGRSVFSWIIVIACAISAGSSASGTPMLTSRMLAPPAICSSTSIRTCDRSPARSCSWKSLRPVGLMRSPMMQKGWSSPIVTVLDGEDTVVRMLLPLGSGLDAQVVAETRH